MHLVAFVTVDELTGLFIFGDKTVIKVLTDIMKGVHLLMVTYYVFNVEFPRMYRMFLQILQVLVVSEPRKDARKKFNFFLKKLRVEMDHLPSEVVVIGDVWRGKGDKGRLWGRVTVKRHL